MTGKPVVPRATARLDIDRAIDWYAAEAGADVVLRFLDDLEAAFRAIGRNPLAGSPRYAQVLSIPGLRSRALARFPYLVFYVDRADRADVWRVLHAQRDIPTSIGESDP